MLFQTITNICMPHNTIQDQEILLHISIPQCTIMLLTLIQSQIWSKEEGEALSGFRNCSSFCWTLFQLSGVLEAEDGADIAPSDLYSNICNRRNVCHIHSIFSYFHVTTTDLLRFQTQSNKKLFRNSSLARQSNHHSILITCNLFKCKHQFSITRTIRQNSHWNKETEKSDIPPQHKHRIHIASTENAEGNDHYILDIL